MRCLAQFHAGEASCRTNKRWAVPRKHAEGNFRCPESPAWRRSQSLAKGAVKLIWSTPQVARRQRAAGQPETREASGVLSGYLHEAVRIQRAVALMNLDSEAEQQSDYGDFDHNIRQH